MNNTELINFNNDWYNPGNLIKRVIWYITSILFFKSSIYLPYKYKSFILKMFGCEIGKNVVIKPGVNIKYPWFLVIGDSTWIGENVWIDNLTNVNIGKNVCISQGAFIFTGNHNYKRSTFDLITAPIQIEDGVWIGAKSIVCPGVKLANHSVISAGSTITRNTKPYIIYQGNPAKSVRDRVITK